MTALAGWFMGRLYDNIPSADAIGGAARVTEIAKAVALNSDAQVTYEANDHGGGSRAVVAGNKTEGALLHMLHANFGLDYQTFRASGGSFAFRENFSSARKRMTTIFRAASGGDYEVYCKGASEMVLELCSSFRTPEGTDAPLDAGRRSELLQVIEGFATRGLRTFAVAVRVLPAAAVAPFAVESLPAGSEEQHAAWGRALETAEQGLTLLLVAGIADPVRAAVPAAVASCKAAGIKVRMVTGDNLTTARSIAAACGILGSGECIEGKTWREMTPEQRSELAPRLDVMARAVPQDKLLLVECLKALGETVAVTGDGTNDAPALRAAHVGCAMGIAGTEVAKEAGKMIILDDNFASIVTAVVWGRSVLENIRKFLIFQLTINVVAGLLTFVMACLIASQPHKESSDGHSDKADFPLTAVQLLWLNLIMDSFAALMLATEPPDEELMSMPPQDKTKPLMTRTMTKHVLGQAIYQLILLLVLSMTTAGTRLFLVPDEHLGGQEHYSNVFNTFVWMNIFNLFNCRRIHDQSDIFRGFGRSQLGLGVFVLIIILQIIIIEVGGSAFQTFPLSGQQWGINLAVGATSLPLGMLLRLVPIRAADDEASARAAAIAQHAAALAAHAKAAAGTPAAAASQSVPVAVALTA